MEVSGQFHAPGSFTQRGRAPITHSIRSWEGPRAVLDTVVKRKIPSMKKYILFALYVYITLTIRDNLRRDISCVLYIFFDNTARLSGIS
jgi:hypothetical protein